MDVAVLGSGSWGTALTILLARNGHNVTLLGRSAAEIEHLREFRENRRYLPGFAIPQSVQYDLLHAELPAVDLTVVAVPAGAVRNVIAEVGGTHPLIALCAKGLEAETGALLTDVVAEVKPEAQVGVLSGPNLALEIARGVPTVALSAFPDPEASAIVRDAFTCHTFRVSTTDDVVGIELAGALKNVLAIGAGMSDGLGFGDNTKGAFLSRGLMEMARLGAAMGAKAETFLGPAGVGDLFATACSALSRNYRVGHAIGEGSTLESAIESLGQVAEGVPTSQAAIILARQYQVDMPVFAAVQSVLKGRLSPQQAVGLLMDRGASMLQFPI